MTGMRALVVLAAVVLCARAAPTDANASMTVTLSAGPISVMEPPPGGPAWGTHEETPEQPHGGTLQALVAAGLREAGAGAEVGSGSGRARSRDLASLVSRAAHRLIRSLGDELRDLAEGAGPPAGRRKKGDAWPMLGAGLIMGGTLLTVGLGALAAMAGKALMSAMLALGMSLMSALRAPPRRCRRSDNNGCGNNDGNDNYEIIARPVITHGHTHSAVLHHDPGVGVPTYPGYVRSLVQTPPEHMQAFQAGPSTTVDVTDFARSGATRLGPADSSADESNPAAWVGGVIGMRGPDSHLGQQPAHQQAHHQAHHQAHQQAHQGGGGGSDSVLSLTLGTWGQQQPKQRNTQPRGLPPTGSPGGSGSGSAASAA